MRHGFVLLAVLSWLGATGAVAATIAVQTQTAIGATANRVADERSEWMARGCIERVFSRVSFAHAHVPAKERLNAWRDLAEEALTSAASDSCRVSAKPGGALLPVNAVSEETLGRYLYALGYLNVGVAASIVDWIDSDTLTMQGMSEAKWYVAEARPTPPNISAVGPADLRWARGLTLGDSTLLRKFDYRASHVALLHADLPTLRSLPALGPSLIEALASGRVRQSGIESIELLERFATPVDAEIFRAAFPELAATATLDAEFWLLTMDKLSARVVRSGDALALTDWRRGQ